MKNFLYWLSGFLPFREISDGNVPYLERYYIGTLLGLRFYLHRFVGSDPDRGIHDHPWKFAFSIILSGWYWEVTSYGLRQIRWFNWLVGDSKHRVVLPCDHKKMAFFDAAEMKHCTMPCWTLFVHTVGDAKAWGMYTPVDGQQGKLLFTPYTYDREGSQKDWWLTAKRRGVR